MQVFIKRMSFKKTCFARQNDVNVHEASFTRVKLGGGNQHEGKTFCKTYLREMQSHSPQRECNGYLRKSETQTKTRLIEGGVA